MNKTESTWHNAPFYMQRLHLIMVLMRKAKIKNDYPEWLKHLWCFYDELSAVMTSKDQKECRKNIQLVEDAINDKKSTKEIRDGLREEEVRLRTLMNKHDLLVPKKDSFDFGSLIGETEE